MAHTPQQNTINRLLQGLNNGLNIFKKDGGPRIDSDSLSDEEERIKDMPSILNSNANGIGSVTVADNNVHLNNISNISTPGETTKINVVTSDAMATGKRTPPKHKRAKKPPGSAASKKNNKANNSQSNDTKKTTDPSVDPPRKKVINPLEMEEAFDNGYDSDGWEGPPPGTDKREIEALFEEEVGAGAAAAAVCVLTEPKHVPIADDVLNKLTVENIKHELEIRNVGLPRNKKKDSLRNHLKDALSKEMPVLPANQIKKATGDDMADFAVGAYWSELKPDIDVEEPVNEAFPRARAPTVPVEDAGVPPRPKQSFSTLFDRPVFTGKQRGGPRGSFLAKHNLTKDSLPFEFADAFFPMYDNKERDDNGDPMLSMEYLARNTNMRANLAFAGEATYDDWSGPFSIKEMRQHLGLYVMNGLSPSPSLEKKFDVDDMANYNPFVAKNINSTGNPKRRL